MKKLLSIFISTVTIFSPLFVSAATNTNQAPIEGTIVATVNIYNAKIISQKDRDFDISFDISNRVGVQSQIKYSVGLTSGTSTINEYVYPETIFLGEGVLINKSIKYTVPDSLSAGTYHLWIKSSNNSGLLLAIVDLGKITIGTNTKPSVQIIPESCYLTINGAGHYVNNALLTASSTLVANCSVKSTLSSVVDFTPLFETRKNSSFGTVVNIKNTPSIIKIKPGIQEVSISLPEASQAGNYFVNIFASSTVAKSNPVSFIYIVKGIQGSIDNLVFDKASYKAGETAHLQILATFSTATGTVIIDVKDTSGQSCSTPLKQDVPNGVSVISIPITKDCDDPQALITLSTNDLNNKNIILDSNNYGVNSQSGYVATKSNQVINIIIYLIIIFFIFAVIYFFKKKNKGSVLKIVTFFVLGTSLFLSSGSTAKADTAHYQNQGCYPGGSSGFCVVFYYNVTYPGVNSDIFNGKELKQNIGNTMTISAAMSNSFTSDPDHPIFTAVDASVEGVTYRLGSCTGSCATSGSHSFAVSQPVALGNHPIGMYLWGIAQQGNSGVPYSGCNGWSWGGMSGEGCLRDVSGPFTFNLSVVDPATTISASPSTISPNGTSSISWNTSNVQLCTITKDGAVWISPYATHNVWIWCSGEGGRCTAPFAPADIRYGQYGAYYYWGGPFLVNYVPSGSWYGTTYPNIPWGYWDCNNGAFGGDPIPGIGKMCEYYGPQQYVVSANLSSTGYPTGPLATTTTFGISCTMQGQVATISSVTVNVLNPIRRPVVDCTLNPSDPSCLTACSSGLLRNADGTCPIGCSTGYVVNRITGMCDLVTTNSSNSTCSTNGTCGSGGSGGTVTPLGACSLSQSGSLSSSKIYINKTVTWSIGNGIVGSTIWSGDGIGIKAINGTTLNTIYTTIGLKTIYATTTDVSGKQYTCFATTSVGWTGVTNQN